MTSKERVRAVLAGKMPDMVPILPVVDGYFAPKIIGRRNDECFLDGLCLAEALAACLKQFGYDGAVAEMGLGGAPNVLGAPVEMDGNDVPLVVDTLISSPEDLEKISLPDPWAGGKMEPVERLIAEVGKDHAVLGSVRSPFEYAATIRGLPEFMTDFYRDPGFVHDLIAAVAPATQILAEALAEAGVDAVVMKDSFASSSMISPDHYRQFALPYETAAIEGLKGIVPVILHICRNSTPIIPLMAQTGAAALEVDSLVDLADTRQAIGHNIILKGNIDAVSVIEKGNRDDVEAAVKLAIAAAGSEGSFILSTGDSVPLSAPAENMAALVEFGRKYGEYQ